MKVLGLTPPHVDVDPVSRDARGWVRLKFSCFSCEIFRDPAFIEVGQCALPVHHGSSESSSQYVKRVFCAVFSVSCSKHHSFAELACGMALALALMLHGEFML